MRRQTLPPLAEGNYIFAQWSKSNHTQTLLIKVTVFEIHNRSLRKHQ